MGGAMATTCQKQITGRMYGTGMGHTFTCGKILQKYTKGTKSDTNEFCSRCDWKVLHDKKYKLVVDEQAPPRLLYADYNGQEVIFRKFWRGDNLYKARAL